MSADERDESSRKSVLQVQTALTRARVADDIQELSRKLSPTNLKSEARQAIVKSVEQRVSRAEQGVTRFTALVKRTVTRHPLPLVAIAGLGVGLWVWRARRA